MPLRSGEMDGREGRARLVVAPADGTRDASCRRIWLSRVQALAARRRLLVLNIWTPAVRDGRKRPVMFWCHGGGFATGSGSSPVTEGANLARRGDVVVVTINHRLNVLPTYLGEAGGGNTSRRRRNARHRACASLGEYQHRTVWRRSEHVTIFGQSGSGW
jgi:para-nitrobenzyl esterase